MKINYLIDQLEMNREVMLALLSDVSTELIIYKPSPQSWNLLEIICHLIDEEKEDFRLRVKHVIEYPETTPPSIDPVSWVMSRNYLDQDFGKKLKEWDVERKKSIREMKELAPTCNFNSGFDHPTFGRMTAYFFLRNWIAHDYLHIRQITRNKYQFLEMMENRDVSYAGRW
ncbi:MAG: DinB family protein [Bacteroidia bacterium]|nr:DinB family protein [Bacteroidia bacterium]